MTEQSVKGNKDKKIELKGTMCHHLVLYYVFAQTTGACCKHLWHLRPGKKNESGGKYKLHYDAPNLLSCPDNPLTVIHCKHCVRSKLAGMCTQNVYYSGNKLNVMSQHTKSPIKWWQSKDDGQHEEIQECASDWSNGKASRRLKILEIDSHGSKIGHAFRVGWIACSLSPVKQGSTR